MISNKVSNLNTICPYFAMFPIDFPSRIIEEHMIGNDPNSCVLDPFCGRGTTNYAARLAGLYTIGIDCSPVAVAISKAKLSDSVPNDIVARAQELIESYPDPIMPSGEFWSLAFNNGVLKDLCSIREGLLEEDEKDDDALRGLMLGALHGPLGRTTQSYLSNQCPRTYAPKPRYSIRYWKERSMRPPSVDVLRLIERRAQRHFGAPIPEGRGSIHLGDSTDKRLFFSLYEELDAVGMSVDLIVTSPPYMGMNTYVQDQWLRNWFVGGPDEVDYSTGRQISRGGINGFVESLKGVWDNCASVSNEKTRLVIRFGAINSYVVDPTELIYRSFDGTPWKINIIEKLGSCRKSSRQVNSFNRDVKEPIAEIDVMASIYR